jgi:PAS domain S-box-containing protein
MTGLEPCVHIGKHTGASPPKLINLMQRIMDGQKDPRPDWNEQERLRALVSYEILDTPPEGPFEHIVQMASQACEAPIALITLVDKDRQWFKASVGVSRRETPLSESICSHAILHQELFVVPDASVDSRFINNPLVQGREHVRFYAGAVLKTPDGLPLGTVSVLDHRPRTLSEQQAFTLNALAVQVMTQLELRRALKAKSESEKRYRFLADKVPQIVWTAKPDGNLDYYNQRWFDYAGTNFQQMEELGWTFFVHPDDLPNAARVWQHALETGNDYEVEFRLKRASDANYRWHLVRAFPMKGEDGDVIQWVGTCTDIDDQLKANELLEKTVAERTTKLQDLVAELEAYSYSVSHDLRSPLRAIMGFSQIIQEDHGSHLDPEGKRYLERINLAGKRMDELITDVLTYSQVSRTELALLSLSPYEVIREVVETYPHLNASKIDLNIQGDLPLVLANKAALSQCVSNLIGNAAKFVAPGVKPRVEVSAEKLPGFVRLWFKDNGIGMEPKNLSMVFEIFQRVDQSREGSGIGLAIVKKAVERMGGKAGVESDLGKGSAFWIELPAA